MRRLYTKRGKLQYAKRMRKKPTEAERAAAWLVLLGFKRQVVVNGYIADFYNPLAQVIVEVDGSIHKQKRKWDRRRDGHNKAKRILTVRISNRRALKGSKLLLGFELIASCVLWYLWRTIIL